MIKIKIRKRLIEYYNETAMILVNNKDVLKNISDKYKLEYRENKHNTHNYEIVVLNFDHSKFIGIGKVCEYNKRDLIIEAEEFIYLNQLGIVEDIFVNINDKITLLSEHIYNSVKNVFNRVSVYSFLKRTGKFIK